MEVKSYKDLIVWQKSFSLSILVYKTTKTFPKEEMYGLTSQIRRSAASIPSNIAEGRHRGSTKEFVQFLRISYGSCAELETQIDISKSLNFIDERSYNLIIKDIQEVGKILNVMISKLEAKS